MNLLTKLLGRSNAETTTWFETKDLSVLLKGPSPPLVVDVREPDEFLGPLGHIDTARNIPLSQIPAQAAALIHKQRPVVFVCHTDRRSAAAADHLQRAGGTNIAVLHGGMVAWHTRSLS